MTPLKRAQQGFSLIELMITVAVVSILTAVALPSYQQYQVRAGRAEGKAALLRAAQWLERAATVTGSYPAQTAFPTGLGSSESGRYTIAYVPAPTTGGATYTLTATPVSTGPQATDAGTGSTVCGNFTLTQAGVKGVTGGMSVSDCWNR
jgi:type IV pilus assembly protein PilE